MSGTAFVQGKPYHLASGNVGGHLRRLGAQYMDATAYDSETEVKLIVLDTADGIRILVQSEEGEAEDVTDRFFADFNKAVREWYPAHEEDWTPEANDITEFGVRRPLSMHELENYPE